jgi:hypothetical protein
MSHEIRKMYWVIERCGWNFLRVIQVFATEAEAMDFIKVDSIGVRFVLEVKTPL